MPTPFPGMDPYLENPRLWPNVHSSLIIAIRDELVPLLRPRYYVAVEERTVQLGSEDLNFVMRPDVAVVQPETAVPTRATSPATDSTVTAVIVELPMLDEIRETYLEIRTVRSDQVITVLEILSPTNKSNATGRRQYEQKRLNLMSTRTHLVEIDLLRAGEPLMMWGYTQPRDYHILVSRAEQRPQANLYPFQVRQPIPPFQLPLQKGDTAPTVHLNDLLHTLYDRAGYDLRLNYQLEATPPLAGEDADWADTLLRQAGWR